MQCIAILTLLRNNQSKKTEKTPPSPKNRPWTAHTPSEKKPTFPEKSFQKILPKNPSKKNLPKNPVKKTLSKNSKAQSSPKKDRISDLSPCSLPPPSMAQLSEDPLTYRFRLLDALEQVGAAMTCVGLLS